MRCCSLYISSAHARSFAIKIMSSSPTYSAAAPDAPPQPTENVCRIADAAKYTIAYYMGLLLGIHSKCLHNSNSMNGTMAMQEIVCRALYLLHNNDEHLSSNMALSRDIFSSITWAEWLQQKQEQAAKRTSAAIGNSGDASWWYHFYTMGIMDSMAMGEKELESLAKGAQEDDENIRHYAEETIRRHQQDRLQKKMFAMSFL